MVRLIKKALGEVRAAALEKLQTSFDTSQILTAIDDLDRFCARWKRESCADLLTVHYAAPIPLPSEISVSNSAISSSSMRPHDVKTTSRFPNSRRFAVEG
jgi:hypothetical protein